MCIVDEARSAARAGAYDMFVVHLAFLLYTSCLTYLILLKCI